MQQEVKHLLGLARTARIEMWSSAMRCRELTNEAIRRALPDMTVREIALELDLANQRVHYLIKRFNLRGSWQDVSLEKDFICSQHLGLGPD